MSILIIALILPAIIISIIASTKSEDQEHGVGMFAFDKQRTKIIMYLIIATLSIGGYRIYSSNCSSDGKYMNTVIRNLSAEDPDIINMSNTQLNLTLIFTPRYQKESEILGLLDLYDIYRVSETLSANSDAPESDMSYLQYTGKDPVLSKLYPIHQSFIKTLSSIDSKSTDKNYFFTGNKEICNNLQNKVWIDTVITIVLNISLLFLYISFIQWIAFKILSKRLSLKGVV